MKTIILSALALSLSVPALATSLIHPMSYSISGITEVLAMKEVVAQLYPLNEMINSIERTPKGWQVNTDHCKLEVTFTWVALQNPRPLPMPQTRRVVNVGTCR